MPSIFIRSKLKLKIVIFPFSMKLFSILSCQYDAHSSKEVRCRELHHIGLPYVGNHLLGLTFAAVLTMSSSYITG